MNADVLKLTGELFERFKGAFTRDENKRFGAQQRPAVQTYIERLNWSCCGFR